jgi:Domain of unknown function (DUF4919)
MTARIFFLITALLISKLAYEQTETPPEPPFIYKRDFKAILDSSQDRTSNLYYQKLIIRFLNNDSSLTNSEVLALMIGYTENPHYKPLEDMEKEQEIYDLNLNGECREVIKRSRPYLQTHPLSLLILREISYAYQQVSKREYQANMIMDSAVLYQDSGKYFMDLNDKIMEAMIYSGKGRTPEAPIFSLGIADGEYFIPNVGFRIETDGQKEKKDTEWNKDGNFVEVITALVDNVNVRKYYFIIQHAKQKIDDDAANELAAKKAEKEKKAEKSKKKGKDKKAALDLDKMTPQTDSIIPELKGLIPGNDSIPNQKVIDSIPAKSVN